jgi:hypothetical protein
MPVLLTTVRLHLSHGICCEFHPLVGARQPGLKLSQQPKFDVYGESDHLKGTQD